MQFWLTEQQVIELTGKSQRAAQIRELEALGYNYRRRSDGSIVVPTDQFTTSETGKAQAMVLNLEGFKRAS